MGFSIILRLDDVAAQRTTTAQLAASLRRCLGSDPYPRRGLAPVEDGPWLRLGAVHSSEQAGIMLTDSGGELAFTVGGPVAVPGDDQGPVDPAEWLAQLLDDRFGPTSGGFHAQLTAADHSQVAARVNRGDPNLVVTLVEAQPGGDAVLAALYGPDPLQVRRRVSLWWFHADALTCLPDDDTLGTALHAALTDRFTDAVGAGASASALRRAGVLTGPGPVVLVYSGNRVCLPQRLTQAEQTLLVARLERFS